MALIIVLSLTGMLVIMTVTFNKYSAQSNYKTLQKTCDAVADFTRTAKMSGEPTDRDLDQYLYYIISNISDVSEHDVIVTDTTGAVRSCSCDEWKAKNTCMHSKHAVSNCFIAKIRKSDVTQLNDLGIYERPRCVYAKAIFSDGTFIGTVIAAAPMSVTRSLAKKIMKYYLISAIIPLIVIFFAIYVLTYRLTKPLKQMSRAAQAMAKGDFSKRIPVTSDDEIGELAVSFNQMTNSLVQLEKMRRSFVANISHELKTPMTTIGGFIDGIIDGTIEPQKQQDYLQIVSDEVKRLSRLVESMLNVAKLESGEFVLKSEEFDFRKLLLDIVISQEQRIDQKKLDIEGLDALPTVILKADRDLIYQAAYNLVDNAIKFVNVGGTVSFALSAESNRMIFSVTNTGKGIPVDSLPYVFERFYKVDKSRSANKNSTGLGLYLVKTIVKSHGGTVSAFSIENKETTFTVSLPL